MSIAHLVPIARTVLVLSFNQAGNCMHETACIAYACRHAGMHAVSADFIWLVLRYCIRSGWWTERVLILKPVHINTVVVRVDLHVRISLEFFGIRSELYCCTRLLVKTENRARFHIKRYPSVMRTKTGQKFSLERRWISRVKDQASTGFFLWILWVKSLAFDLHE
jgi:hypothetical protein